jgi:hypothetical protein
LETRALLLLEGSAERRDLDNLMGHNESVEEGLGVRLAARPFSRNLARLRIDRQQLKRVIVKLSLQN